MSKTLDIKQIEQMAKKKFPIDKKGGYPQKKPITRALEAAGLDRSYWSRWKTGTNSPTLSTLDKLLKVLK